MKYRGFYVNIPNFHLCLKYVLFAVIAIILTTSFSVFAEAPQPANSDEVKKIIKQATKLRRNGSLAEAEALLRSAVELDGKRTEARVELAYVLTKQRKLFDAYNLVYEVAKADPKNSRAMAVLGATLLSGGRFVDARLILFNALRLNKKEHLAWAGFGMLNFYENNIDESLQNLMEAVYHKPDEPDYLFALAQVSARSEKYQEAAEAYRDFLSISDSADAERRARIKGLISFLTFLGQTERLYVSAGQEKTTVPFELVGNRPIIKLRVNGKNEPLRFVLDTGSGISVVSDETAKRLKIKKITRGGYAKGIGGNGKFEIVYGLLREIRIGEVSLKNVPVYLRKFHHDSQRVDGYIGLSLISKFLATIDYGNQTFSLLKREAYTGEVGASTDLSLPLRLTSSGFLSGEVQLEGHDSMLNFIVDTGASVSVISDRVAKEEGISRFVNSERLRVIGAAGVTDEVPTFLLPRVSFGSHSRRSIMAVALDLDIINEASGFEQSGILGGNFLKNYRLTFDFKNSKVTFISIKPEKE